MKYRGIVLLMFLSNLVMIPAMRLAFQPPLYWLLFVVWTAAMVIAMVRLLLAYEKAKPNE